jgi:hypothetical protein
LCIKLFAFLKNKENNSNSLKQLNHKYFEFINKKMSFSGVSQCTPCTNQLMGDFDDLLREKVWNFNLSFSCLK